MFEYKASALLFDMDGTLVDSTAVVRSTWTAFAERHGLDADKVLAFAHGRPTGTTVSEFIGDGVIARRETARIVAEEETTVEGIAEIPGATALLRSIPASAWSVVTSAGRTLALNRMAAAGIPIPDILVSAEDIVRGKPDPQGYSNAAAMLEVDIADCLVFEDSHAGIRAGIASGARTIAVGDLAEFDHLIPRIADFSKSVVTTHQLCGDVTFTDRSERR
ncbi:HAD-IA family hydrolase [Nocardia abscessus]|uniref:HAD-IA family hydrolase n=1 Tax=Nocardia abscessus TaxID=120957 RepID=UPI002455A6E1|nr:HAD-IA family hydrolase [Nocardia abscessus]